MCAGKRASAQHAMQRHARACTHRSTHLRTRTPGPWRQTPGPSRRRRRCPAAAAAAPLRQCSGVALQLRAAAAAAAARSAAAPLRRRCGTPRRVAAPLLPVAGEEEPSLSTDKITQVSILCASGPRSHQMKLRNRRRLALKSCKFAASSSPGRVCSSVFCFGLAAPLLSVNKALSPTISCTQTDMC